MDNKILLLPIIGVTTFFILLFTFTKFLGPIPFAVNSVTTTKSDTFQVTEEGSVSVIPDIASVSVGVRVEGPTVKQAQDQLNSNINKVIDSIKDLGIDREDLHTTNYSISPDYDYSTQPQRIKGYSASSNIFIKVKDINKINSVIDTATSSGANQVGSINFNVDDRSKAENEAREKAVAKAKKKAEDAAKIAGFKLGRIINYSEGSFNPGPFPAQAFGVAEVSPDKTTLVEPGSSEITITVTLSYEIK